MKEELEEEEDDDIRGQFLDFENPARKGVCEAKTDRCGAKSVGLKTEKRRTKESLVSLMGQTNIKEGCWAQVRILYRGWALSGETSQEEYGGGKKEGEESTSSPISSRENKVRKVEEDSEEDTSSDKDSTRAGEWFWKKRRG